MATPLLRDRHMHEQARRDRIKARLDRAADLPTTATMTAGGDNLALRGIPAIGRGVAGAIRDTSPDWGITSSDGSRTMRGVEPTSSA